MVSIKPFIPLFSSFWEKHQPAWRCSMYLLKFYGPFPKLCLQTWPYLGVYFTQLAGVLAESLQSLECYLRIFFYLFFHRLLFAARRIKVQPPLLPFRNKLFTENHKQQNNSLAWLPALGSAERDSNKKWKLCAGVARVTLRTPLSTSAQAPERASMHHITANMWAPNTAPAAPKLLFTPWLHSSPATPDPHLILGTGKKIIQDFTLNIHHWYCKSNTSIYR